MARSTTERTLHYIPVFTRRIRDTQEAICGAYVTRQEHASEPTCETCQNYLAAAEEENRELSRSLEKEYPDHKGKLFR